MESAAENSRSVDGRTPAERTQPRSWVSRIALLGSLLLLAYFVWLMPTQYARLQLAQAEILAKAEKYEEALASLDSASRFLPKVPGVFIVRAQIYSKMGNKKAAEENLELALPLLGDSPRDLTMFADVAADLNLDQVVAQTCDKIDEIAPKQPMETHRHLLNAAAYCRAVVNRDVEKGLRGIDRALKLPEGMPSLTVAGLERAMFEDTRALLLYRQGKNEEALTDINNAIAYIEKAYEREFGVPMPTPGATETPKPPSDSTEIQKTSPEKVADTKAAESKTAESKTAESKTGESKTGESKTGESKTGELGSATDSDADLKIKSGPYKGLSKPLLENWAVMYNHRQMIREALGDKAGAELDRKRIVDMGQTPGDKLH